jgi:hypothetical protein
MLKHAQKQKESKKNCLIAGMGVQKTERPAGLFGQKDLSVIQNTKGFPLEPAAAEGGVF